MAAGLTVAIAVALLPAFALAHDTGPNRLAVSAAGPPPPPPPPLCPPDPFERNDIFATATPTSLPFAAAASIDPQTDVDFYVFTLPVGASLAVSAGSASGQVFRLDLFDARETPVASGAGSLQQQVVAGQYFLRVSAAAAGCYTLRISAEAPPPPPPPPPPADPFEPNNDFATATAISLPFGGGACIDPQTDVDFYRFSVPSGVRLSASTSSRSGQPFRLDFFDGLHTLVASGTGRVDLDVGTGGEFFARVSADAVGCYVLRVSAAVPPPPPPPPVDPNEPNDDFAHATPITPNSLAGLSDVFPVCEVDFFRFDAAAGSELAVTATSAQLQPLVALFDAAGRPLASGSSVRLRLDAAGTYFIRVTPPCRSDADLPAGGVHYTLSVFLFTPRVLVPGHSLDFVPPFPQFPFLVAADPDTGVLYVLRPDLVDLVVPLPAIGATVKVPAFSDLVFAGGFGGATLLATDTQGRTVALNTAGGQQRIFADTRGGLFGGLALAGDRLFVSTGFFNPSAAIYAVDRAGSVSTFLAPPALSSIPMSLAVSPDGRTLYYTDIFRGDLVQVDVASAAEVGRVHIGPSLSFSRLAVDPASGDVYATVFDLISVLGGGVSPTVPAGDLVRYQPATGEVQPFAVGVPVFPGFNLTFGPCVEGQISQDWCLFVPTVLGVMKIHGFHAPLITTSLTYAGDTGVDFNDQVTLAADLKRSRTQAPVLNAHVEFTLGSQGCSGTTDSTGHVSCTLTLDQDPGRYTVSASFAGDSVYKTATGPGQAFTITKEETRVTYNGPTTSDYHDPFTASATLVDPVGGAPISGKTIQFTLGAGDTCSAVTDGSGTASCSITPTQSASTVTISASFGGDTDYVPGSDGHSFVITKEETTLVYTGPTVIANGFNVTVKGVLTEDLSPPISGRAVSFALSLQTCSGITDASGSAPCTILVNSALGPVPISASFAGDAWYQPSSAIVFAFPRRGGFAIGDLNNVPGGSVTFWSEHWRKLNTLTGGKVPGDFQGFISKMPALPACGIGWTNSHRDQGKGGEPPATVPTYMGTIVSSSIKKVHDDVVGNTVSIVVVKTDPAYDPEAGESEGTGKIVATYC